MRRVIIRVNNSHDAAPNHSCLTSHGPHQPVGEAQEEGKAEGSRRRPREFFSVKQHEFTQLGQVLAGNEDTMGTFQT